MDKSIVDNIDKISNGVMLYFSTESNSMKLININGEVTGEVNHHAIADAMRYATSELENGARKGEIEDCNGVSIGYFVRNDSNFKDTKGMKEADHKDESISLELSKAKSEIADLFDRCKILSQEILGRESDIERLTSFNKKLCENYIDIAKYQEEAKLILEAERAKNVEWENRYTKISEELEKVKQDLFSNGEEEDELLEFRYTLHDHIHTVEEEKIIKLNTEVNNWQRKFVESQEIVDQLKQELDQVKQELKVVLTDRDKWETLLEQKFFRTLRKNQKLIDELKQTKSERNNLAKIALQNIYNHPGWKFRPEWMKQLEIWAEDK